MRHTDEALQAAEARKLFQGLQRKSVPVEPEFLRPIVQTAVERGKPETAHELWTTLSADMALPPSLSIATDIIRGYGRQGSWTRIDEVITRLHNQGLSRVKPVGFAAVVRHAFNLYATFSPSAEDTYDFLTYCIQSCGVLPTPKLSSDVLYLFLRRRRYDLVQKWMKDRQVYFPGLANPANDNNTAFGIATAWASGYTHRISTLDVLATCKTLARGAVRDPFSDELRYVAQEVIESDVLACCDKLCTAVGNETMQDLATVPKAFRSYQDLHAYAADVLSRALEAKRYRNPLSKKHSTRISLLSRALKSRLIDAYEAHLLLHDFEGYLAIYGFPVYEHQAQEPSDTVTEAEEDRMTRKFSQHWRYHTQTTTEIFSHIDTVYQKLETKGEYIQRNVFFMAFTALTSIERYRSVLSLLRKLRKSKWSDRVLNGQLLALWVRTATAVTHPPALREALWAVVDSPHSIEVSARFLVLVRLAQVDLKHYHDMGWRQVTQEQLDEVEYLKKRIYRRKWCQMGCPDAEDIQERNLREWARGMTDEDFNAVKKEAAAVAEKYPVAKVEESVVQPRPTPSGAVLPLGSQLQLPTTVTKHILLEPTEEPTDTTPAESFAMHEEMPRTDDRAIPSADEQTLPASMNTSTPRPFAPWVDMPPIPGHAASSTEDHDTAPTTERRVRKTGTIPADESSKQQQHPAKADPTPHSPASPHRNIRLRSRLWAEKTKIRRRGSKLVRRLRASGQEMRLIVKRSVERPNVRYLYRGTGKSKPKLRYLRTDKVEEA
ncbi:hypothetical protein PMZ80_002248 [Knufia obscura]|uniref:Uncharacterized protein n=2 Tax=Knufia TaxID=430999 RepID=A0AAN8ERF1_9EURO|nr:hypothetical protein PMZ80_002248 [Knufia obscura]KAK5950608.1 hypothetical protein OHC33_008274 [Knufia fluminis]